jgi:hypothetical protein
LPTLPYKCKGLNGYKILKIVYEKGWDNDELGNQEQSQKKNQNEYCIE